MRWASIRGTAILNTLRRRHVAILAVALLATGVGADDRGLDQLAVPRIPVCCCYEPGPNPDWDAVHEMEEILEGGLEFQTFGRWTATATNPSTGTNGDPVTIRYSFLPDGTPMYGGAGELPLPSNLMATFNLLYGGNTSAWQGAIAAAFDRWTQLTGITFIHEPNDDGAATVNLPPGIIGVRGDIRIGGHNVDGQSGSNILAYSSYPNFGDICIDTSNLAFFANQFSNSLNLRNLIGHEIGHALGLKHSCPWNYTKLMEPFINAAFDGPQHDDVQGAHQLYGDRRENNDTQATATSLGLLQGGTLTLDDLSCDSAIDVDWFRFTIGGPEAVTVTVTPIGATYASGPETNGVCTPGTPYNSLVANDLAVEVRDSSGGLVAGANSYPAGQAESIVSLALLTYATPWYVRVMPGPGSAPQIYRLAITIADGASGSAVGSGCASGAVPNLSTTIPVIGAPVVISVTNALPNRPGMLVASYGAATSTSMGGGCTAYVDLGAYSQLASFTTNGLGTFTYVDVVPSIPTLVGLDLVLQAAIFPASGPMTFNLTNGINMQLGY